MLLHIPKRVEMICVGGCQCGCGVHSPEWAILLVGPFQPSVGMPTCRQSYFQADLHNGMHPGKRSCNHNAYPSMMLNLSMMAW